MLVFPAYRASARTTILELLECLIHQRGISHESHQTRGSTLQQRKCEWAHDHGIPRAFSHATPCCCPVRDLELLAEDMLKCQRRPNTLPGLGSILQAAMFLAGKIHGTGNQGFKAGMILLTIIPNNPPGESVLPFLSH